MINYPEKIFQSYNGFKFEFFREAIGGCGTINEKCEICGGKVDIQDNGYEDVTDIYAKCEQCGYWQSRYVKYSPYSSPTSYESKAIVKKYDDKNYLTIYNIKWQDEVVVFSLIYDKAKKNEDDLDYGIEFFEKKFEELEDFYQNEIEKLNPKKNQVFFKNL